MGKLSWCFVLVVFAACRPVYDGPSEPMRNPRPVPASKRPKIVEPPVGNVYVDKCEVDFRRDPTGVHRDKTAATTHVAEGNNNVTAAATQPPKSPAKIDLVVAGIKEYQRALEADPYDAEATLQLARAYDEVFYRGCAIAMLRRLDDLAQHPKYGVAARPRARRVADNQDWFHDYRKEALDALGRSIP